MKGRRYPPYLLFSATTVFHLSPFLTFPSHPPPSLVVVQRKKKDPAPGGDGDAAEEQPPEADGDEAAHLPGALAPPRRQAAGGLSPVSPGEERSQADRQTAR